MEKPCDPGYIEPQTYPQTGPPSYDQARITRSQIPAPYFPQNAPGYGYDQAVDKYGAPITSIPNGSRQQANVVMHQPGSQDTTIVVTHADAMPNMSGHIAFSCIVAWCFCLIFGIIAYAIAHEASQAVTIEERRWKGRISFGFSLAGLVIGATAYVAIIVHSVNDNYY